MEFFSGKMTIDGLMDDACQFVIRHQMKDPSIWKKFVEPFQTKQDRDLAWRGEYFGKMMRGGSLLYAYTQDSALYTILEQAVLDLLNTQEPNGRISSYDVEHEFNGWDLWCRKYVLTGLQHFNRINKNPDLKEAIIHACNAHLDYIIDHIGPNKKSITETSQWWGSMNSCTILEPTLEQYKLTQNPAYLEFATYIISTGGSSACNLIELALQNEKAPYEYPVTKAYEMMSFFEGLLAFYEITKEEQYLQAVQNFIEKVYDTDLTLIGCCGCTHEQFDHAKIFQANYKDGLMQETCVTVTWMRLLSRMYFLNGEKKYIDWMEQSGLNALYGSLNQHKLNQFELERKQYFKGLAFDSYSPLTFQSRGRGIGGFQEFASGGYYGCCAAIGGAGVALMPLHSVMQDEDALIINFLCNAEIKLQDADLLIEGDYPSTGNGSIKVICDHPVKLKLRIRIPGYAKKAWINHQEIELSDYYELEKTFKNEEELLVEFEFGIQIHTLNQKIAFTYGPLVLAQDEAKTTENIKDSLPSFPYEISPVIPEKREMVRFKLQGKQKKTIFLTDYASCGKNWLNQRNKISIWFNKK